MKPVIPYGPVIPKIGRTKTTAFNLDLSDVTIGVADNHMYLLLRPTLL